MNTAIAGTNSGGTINISNYTASGNFIVSDYIVKIGADNFTLTGGSLTGSVQTPSTGKLILPASAGGTTYPLTDDEANDFTLSIDPNTDSYTITVKITPKTDLDEEKQASGMLSNTVFEIQGDDDLEATIVFTIPDASIQGGTLPENVIFRYWDTNRYVAIDANRVQIEDLGTSYRVTITGVNEF